jgi:Na+-transporting NADH:ubiquinone oxidoreductase subunit A
MDVKTIKIKGGLNLPISGSPAQEIGDAGQPGRVALLGIDYPGMKPRLEVSVGDPVKLGEVLFTDRKIPSIQYTAPGCGKIISINRGEKRMLLSVIIGLEGTDEVTFESYPENRLQSLDRQTVISRLLESGLWTSLRSRPFSSVAHPETVPHSLFVTAMDTNPLAPSVIPILRGQERDFLNGVTVLAKLTDGRVYLCRGPGEEVPCPELESLSIVEFSGPHPAGNAGTHIHFLDPVNRSKTVWQVGLQDVIAVGKLFTTGRLYVDRVVSLAGPSVRTPRLIRTRLGASLEDVTKYELHHGDQRVISGSVLSGHTAQDETAFLGRYHQQISAVPDDRERRFMGWLRPGSTLYSIKNVFLSRLSPTKRYSFTSSTHGEYRAIYPIGGYEKVMPLDILPTMLLRALAMDDIEEAERLGCLELDEEDLALCTFVCPSKIDHGLNLRRKLITIQKEG